MLVSNDATERTSCGGCGSGNLETILDLGSSPLADAFVAKLDDPQTRYPLRLLLCHNCLLVQLADVVPDHILWDDYGFYSSTSPILASYHQQFGEWVHRNYRDASVVVEIACNDGSLLAHLPAKAVGVDAAIGPVLAAKEKGLDARYGLFNLQMAEVLRNELGPVDLVIAQNVTAHVANLSEFLASIRLLLSDTGHAIIEVQSLADLVLGNEFDHVYHEHRFFFSTQSLCTALTRAGFEIVNVERTPMQGGSIRVTCARTIVPTEPDACVHTTRYGEQKLLLQFSTYRSLQARADYLRQRLNDLVTDELAAGREIAGYAASAKSTTLLNWCQLSNNMISYVVDTTPHKIGRYTPGSNIRIVAPGTFTDPDTYLLLVHNYLGRIRAEKFTGRWIVPIPHPVVIS